MNKIEGLQGKRIIQHVVVTLLILQTIFIENFVACQRRSSNQRSDVYIAGFFPFADGVENSQTGRGVMPSVKLALSHVNENSKILSNYRLHMWWNDTECNAAVGVKSFFDMMHTGPNKLMLFGAACTHVTDPIAKASKHWHLTQLSYADTHPMFTKDAFPNFFRVVPSENAFNTPRLALLKEFNWTRVGTLYQNEPRYSLPHNHMVADLDTIGCEVVETQSFVNDVNESLKKLREKDVRIILGNFNEHFARKVFCEAFKLDMYGRSYQYLIMATYSSNWWNTTGVRYEGDIDCTEEEILTALECAILVDLLPLSTSGDITISGLTADEYLEEYNSMRGSEYSRFHGYTYDGIWAAALAIEYVAGKKQNALDMFNYRDNGWEQVFLEALRNTSFEGVTGPVRFYNNERKANILITQFQQGKEEKIGEYHAQPNRLDLTLGNAVKWFGRAPPKDRTMIIIEHSQVDLTIYIISASFSVIGIILALVFLGFNIKYRNQRYIKMSSPHLNNLIIFGCIMTYASIIFLGLDTTLSSIAAFPYICTARAWLLMAGFSLAFGAMFSKTWRVHSIFTDLKLNKKVIKDYQLFMVVGILLSIDIALITTWQVADPFFRDTKQLEPRHHEYLEDVWVIVENEYCQSEHITVFVGIIYAYKGLLLVFGAFLAWETRHVSIPALNDSKHIGFSVYNVFITCLFGAAISLVLSDRKDLVFILLSFFIVFCTTATLCLVFVPKLLELKRNPQGVVDKRVRATLRPMSKRRDSSVCELEQRMRDVRNTNSRFRKALMEKEAELNALIQKIGPEAKKWIEGVSCTGTAKEPLISNDTLARLAPIVSRELPSATEITEMTSVDSTTSAFAEHFTTSVISTTAPSQQPIKMPIEQSPPTVINASISPYNIPTSTALHNMLKQQNQPDPFTSSSKVESESRKHHKPIEKRNSVSAHSQTDLSLTSKCTDINNTTNHLQERARRQSSVAAGETRGNNNQTSISRTTSASSQRKDSEYSSNTDLNSISCPHTKSNNVRTPSESRRVSMGSSLKSNFVVSQSDLWDTNTLSHTKQHTRQSPRNYQTQTRCTEHSHIIAPYEMSGTSPIQRSVSEKNRNKHRHKPPKGTVCQSETDSEREKDLTPPTTQCMQTRKLSKSTIQQSAHHHSTPNVAPLDKQTYTNSHLQATQHQKQRRHRNKTDTSIYGAYGSESELIEDNGGAGGGNVSSLAGDTSILPIFHKLLTEKQPQYRSRSAVGQSCPNISIKCDIVEYL